jgi:HK97 family phage portal protein
LFSGQTQNEIYLRAYGTSGTIYSIVTTLATSVATPSWRLYRKQPQDGRRRYTTADKGSDQRTEVINHAALSLWNSPNDFNITSEFVAASQQHLELTGECWWLLDRSGPGNFPVSMWLVRPDRMEPIPDPQAYLKGYVYTSPDGQKIPLDVDDVIFTKFPNPMDPYRGLGPVSSILVNIDAMRYANEYNRNFFLNNASPGGVIQVDKRLSDSEWDELTNRWRESHQGVSRAHRVAVLENGASWNQNVITQKDMDFANLIMSQRDVLREAWGIHKSLLGNSDDVNRANAQTAEEVFGNWKILPRLNLLKNALNYRLLPQFGSAGQGVEFDYDNPLPDDREADNAELTVKATAAQMLVNAGWDPDDVLETVGLPAMSVAEKATQQPALPPGWVAAPPAAPAAAPEANPAQKPAQPAQKTAAKPDMDAELANLLLMGLKNAHVNGKEVLNGSH